jgi:hypothetical protein
VPSTANCTLPCGTESPVAATVAVNVIGWPKVDGLTEDSSVVVVAVTAAPSMTVWLTTSDVVPR